MRENELLAHLRDLFFKEILQALVGGGGNLSMLQPILGFLFEKNVSL